MSENRHFTTRRSFITGMGFGAVGLYGVWAAYGAAPLPFSTHHEGLHDGHGEPAEAVGHEGMVHGARLGMTPETFRREHAAFVDKFKRPDGSVEPGPQAAIAHDMSNHLMMGDDTATHDMSDHGMGPHEMSHMSHDSGTDQPVDLYLLAFMWGYNPDTLRLRTGVRYRLRMMADDITHGASLQLGTASRIIRLRPDIVSEQIITFTKPGNVLIYCTVYCGPGHDRMQGKIIVTGSEPGGQS